MGIKRITAANEHLTTGRSRAEAQAYWADSHGKLIANNPAILRYHHYFSLPEAYENEPKPSYIGISMFWRSDLDTMFRQQIQPNVPANGTDDRQLFDRDPRWPTDDQHADIFGDENIIIDGAKNPSMVNVIVMVCKKPGLDHKDFFEHWKEVQVPLATKVPGLRRYIQNPVALASLYRASSTHDGWSEFWFDDYDAFQQAYKSEAWAAMEADGATLFAAQKHYVIGREYIQKDETWKPRDYGALSMSEDQIKERLVNEGYGHLLQDVPDAPAKILAAAKAQKLGVWTPHHLVTLDDSNIDARPRR